MPASSQLNRQKSDRVPSEVMLRGAQTRIQDWWTQAYDGVLGESLGSKRKQACR